ncbi:MAG: hypothetical protein GY827_10340 [Cytophagales bacterium]|nr:hypothetical protein [Cytophagales bacterium]
MRIYLALAFSFILSICYTQAQDSLIIQEYTEHVLHSTKEDNFCLKRNQHRYQTNDIFSEIYDNEPGKLHSSNNDRYHSFYNPPKIYFTKVDEDYYLEVYDLFEQLLLRKEVKKGSTSVEFGGYDQLVSEILESANNEIKESEQILEKYKPFYKRISFRFKKIKKEINEAEQRITRAKSVIKTYENKKEEKLEKLPFFLVRLKPQIKKNHSCNSKLVLRFSRVQYNSMKEKLTNFNTNPVTEMEHLILAEFFLENRCFLDGLHYIYEAQKVAKLDSSSSNNSLSSRYLKYISCRLKLYRRASVTRKPVVYLYPTQEDTIDVHVKYNGELTFTYPKYNNGWKVIAKANGQLTNLEDSTYHNYLFWEGETSLSFQDKLNGKEGWVIKGSEVTSFFQTVLPKYGLTPQEYNDFIVYWGPLMQKNKYNYINFYSNEEYNKIASIETSPKADTFLRLFMVYQALDHPITVREPEISITKRKGFTLVEWGGSETHDYISNNP